MRNLYTIHQFQNLCNLIPIPFNIYILCILLWKRDCMPCISHLIPHQAAQGAFALTCHPTGDACGADFARLGDHHITGYVSLCIVIQNELWQLGGFPTAGRSTNDDHRVILNQRNQLHTQTEGLLYKHIKGKCT